jgi:hypothetical protein
VLVDDVRREQARLPVRFQVVLLALEPADEYATCH